MFDLQILDHAWKKSVIKNSSAANCYEKRLSNTKRRIRTWLDASEDKFNFLNQRLSEEYTPPKNTEYRTSIIHSPSIWLENSHQDPNVPRTLQSRLTSVLNEQLEHICNLRFRIYQLMSDNIRALAKWTLVIEEIEDIEARALSVLILPSVVLDDEEADDGQQLHLLLSRLVSQAMKCFDSAEKLASTPEEVSETETKKYEDKITAASEPDWPCFPTKDKLFPTIEDATHFMELSTNLLYPLLSDYKLRRQTLLVKRIITYGFSQITRNDMAYCLNRMQYLLDFIDGKPIEAIGSSRHAETVSLPNLLPSNLGSVYAWKCLFSAIISQAEHQSSTSFEIAVTFSVLLSGILAKHPHRIPEFFNRMFLACPVLCTFVDHQSTTITQSMMESGDLLPRWRGMARLFAALTIAHPPKLLRCKRPAHLNPSLLWRVIAGIINRPLVVGASAEVLHGLLEVGGTTLMYLYRRQFDKLLSSLVSIIQSSAKLKNSCPENALVTTIELAQRDKRFTHIPSLHPLTTL